MRVHPTAFIQTRIPYVGSCVVFGFTAVHCRSFQENGKIFFCLDQCLSHVDETVQFGSDVSVSLRIFGIYDGKLATQSHVHTLANAKLHTKKTARVFIVYSLHTVHTKTTPIILVPRQCITCG